MPHFYRWRGGGHLEKCFLPTWKVQTNLRPMFRCVELGRDLVNHLWHVGKRQLAQDGAVCARLKCFALVLAYSPLCLGPDSLGDWTSLPRPCIE
jgi:hypothetical protein